ncbi:MULTISPECIES: feruloyl-CoA synthase [Paenalcaligenes]|uniref:Feruloyl-CoA synthase n=1 Tax=Paenalcaligenes hermetiae TaxID=1157987 RepID=A0ABP9M4K4_9BURK|nr:feruloyl-CoA synthase [Paenalcaligenes sp.]
MQSFFDDESQLAPARVEVEHLDNGGFILRSPEPLGPYARCVGEWLEKWAKETPDAIYFAERDGDGWRELTYAQVRDIVGRLGQGLLDMGLSSAQPLVVLSSNDLNHAMLTLAAMHVGVPIGTVSVAYSKGRKDYTKLTAILKSFNPGAIFVSHGEDYAPSLLSVKPSCPIIVGQDPEAIPGSIHIDQLYNSKETPAVMEAFYALTGESHARYLLTSGSTGEPKVVVNTHKMLCSNQQMIAQCWRFLDNRKLRVLDWLPWSHTFGANHNFNMVLRNGGSFYIDDGLPMPGRIERTIENIKYVRPTMFFNVPRGYDVLLPYIEKDPELAEALFADLDALFYAAAALPQNTWDRIHKVASTVRDTPLFFTSEWGATETTPVLTNVHFRIDKPGNLGLPVPGIEIKFIPSGDKLEMRVKGPSVFTEYLNDPELAARSFDSDGFYMIGDAGYLLDEAHPEKGIVFNGRVTEDFKLTTGTWVSVGTLRPALVSALAPYVSDCVICGHDRSEIGVLAFPTPALRELAGPEGETMHADELAQVPAVRQALLKGMKRHYAENKASSRHARRLLLLNSAPNIEIGEITDKGYINQRMAISYRADDVKRLFAEPLDPAVILITEETGE